MTLTADEKWQAVVRCDDTFDNQFIYGVKTTGIFCRPSCKSKTPLRENVKFFENVEAAYAYGLRPCKRCRPDLQIYKPAADIMEKAKKIYDNYFNNNTELHLHIDKLNISRSHLNRVYQKFYGITPNEYISRLRMEKAVLLLANKNISILNIAYECGFSSLSSFYERFKKHIGCTPSEYRKLKYILT